ncbi:sulfonate ABC transporter substrate-binding protein [Zhihengliuella salsuginis]|uniref:Sulfonate ABC transporter substrate-binding protein n=1 Tax=Zhihengliuella salsuginis TaxID=578222 RepID=A0ABQ3GCQ0_9MICC|nr:sulfonate ABC transporter substrate-binding protein [Zhihengliuella salsuginis]
MLLALVAIGTAFVPSPQLAAKATDLGPAEELRLGYFATVTHVPALVGLERGILADGLDPDGTRLETQVFTAGPSAMEAINAGAIDAAYVGPSPAIASYLGSDGASIRVVAGATSGGAYLVAQPGTTDVAGLAGGEIATPQYAGTQDVAARDYLRSHGAEDDVAISHAAAGTAVQLFARGAVAAAWQPEPWASMLVEEHDGEILVDERDLWPGGDFPTSVLVVSQKFAGQHPETVARLVEANERSIRWADEHPDQLVDVADAAIQRAAGENLSRSVLASAIDGMRFTADPLAGTYPVLLERARETGVLPGAGPGGLDGLIDTDWPKSDTEGGQGP